MTDAPQPPPDNEIRVTLDLEWLLSGEVQVSVDGRRIGSWTVSQDGIELAGAAIIEEASRIKLGRLAEAQTRGIRQP